VAASLHWNTNADTHGYANCHTYRDSYSNPNVYANPNPDSYSYGYSNTRHDGNSNRNGDSNGYPHANAYHNSYRDPDCYSHYNPDTYAHSGLCFNARLLEKPRAVAGEPIAAWQPHL
jgi:hypothetical protein